MSEHSACPFCGGAVDPTGWLRGDGLRGPECEDCGATARSIEAWESRAEAQALRERLAFAEDAAAKGDDARAQCGGMEMEIQVLREEVATLRARVVVPDASSQRLLVGELVSLAAGLACRNPLRRLTELCDEQSRVTSARLRGYIDEAGDSLADYAVDLRRIAYELARLNGKAVSEELLHRIADTLDDVCHGSALEKELRALLGEGKEVGDVQST